METSNEFVLEGMTIATTDMQGMVNFYKNVFGVQFKTQEMYGTTLFQGQWLQQRILLCPAAIAQNTAKQNRHQFDIVVPDIDTFLDRVKAHGGKVMAEVVVEGDEKKVGIKDPDGNTMVIKERLKNIS